MTATILNLDPIVMLTQTEFYQLCEINPEAKLELTAHGELVVRSLTGGCHGRVCVGSSIVLGARVTESKSFEYRQFGLG